MSCGRAQSTAHCDPPCRDNSAPVPQLLAPVVPLPHPKAGAHLGAHRRPLTQNCAREWLRPKEKKGGEGQRHKGEGGERRGHQVTSV